MNQQKQVRISLQYLCDLFEVDIGKVPNLAEQGPYKEVEARLEKFKTIFKNAYRKLAMELHPDKVSDPEKIARFKRITSVYKELSKLKVTRLPPQPRPMPTVIIRTGGFGGYSSSTTASSGYTSTSGGFYWHSSYDEDITGK